MVLMFRRGRTLDKTSKIRLIKEKLLAHDYIDFKNSKERNKKYLHKCQNCKKRLETKPSGNIVSLTFPGNALV